MKRNYVPLVEVLGQLELPSVGPVAAFASVAMPPPPPMMMFVATAVEQPFLVVEQPRLTSPLLWERAKKPIDFGLLGRCVKSSPPAPLWYNLYLEAELIMNPYVPLLTPGEIQFWLQFGLM